MTGGKKKKKSPDALALASQDAAGKAMSYAIRPQYYHHDRTITEIYIRQFLSVNVVTSTKTYYFISEW